MFDRTDRESFEACADWLSQARQACAPEVALTLVGTKSDLVGQSSVLDEVSSSEARLLAKAHGVDYHETSAISDLSGIRAFFAQFISLALRKRTQTNTPAVSSQYPDETMSTMRASSESDESDSGEEESVEAAQGELWSHGAMLEV